MTRTAPTGLHRVAGWLCIALFAVSCTTPAMLETQRIMAVGQFPEASRGQEPHIAAAQQASSPAPSFGLPRPDVDPLAARSGVPIGGESAVLVGAGDITYLDTVYDFLTARMLDDIEGTVFTLGDAVQGRGTHEEWAAYDQRWGRHKSRTMPAMGNHEFETDRGRPYYEYWGPRAGEMYKGWYSYQAGTWHVVVVNSMCPGGCGPGSEFEEWLRADLEANRSQCILAYWHHPLFGSGVNGNSPWMKPVWDVLYEYGADVVLNGHDHNYERFLPQDPDGNVDMANGIRQFVVGTGGHSQLGMTTVQPNSEVREVGTYGLLVLNLHPGSYEWQFRPVPGQSFTDSGRGVCN